MPSEPARIVWTEVDEAPALATYSLLPIIRRFTAGTGITIETADISLAGRILANFPEGLTAAQRVPDWLTELGELAKRPRSEYHQTAKHQRVGPAAQGRDQGAAGTRL
jgi:isocitrate dehydrogenase